ncbi:neural cell adhesion molecule 1 [Salvelinus sp. IW2-2015]|uniref:neural cell adhesion molecule 1 n=1 Tax=Salvelinus sp. IW2-2015 TaxID=2691554 RepID=UPI0038D46836
MVGGFGVSDPVTGGVETREGSDSDSLLNGENRLKVSIQKQTHVTVSCLCAVVGVAKEIDWYSPSGEKIEPNKPEITVTRNDESSSTLTLYKAGVDSAGTYKCLATNGDQSAEATVNVKFYQRIIFKNAPSPHEFNEGDNANIICDVISSPPPTIIWKHKGAKIQMEKDEIPFEGIRIPCFVENLASVLLESGDKYSFNEDGSEMTIMEVAKLDEGEYTCIAKNKAGESEQEVSLRVFVKPKITFLLNQSTSEMEEQVTLTCEASGDPTPTINWSFGLRPFTEGEQAHLNRIYQVSCLCSMKPLCRKQRYFHFLTVCPHAFSCLTVVLYVPSESCCVCTVDIDGESALSTGIMAGILILAFVLLLLAVDVTCYFTNKCGLIMCLCGKPGSGAKGHNLEQGKAAFIKDESKEPIVEVRTEDECTANHNAGGPTEPNETTPLTEPELAAHTAALALDTLSSVATISDTANTTYDPTQDSPSSESTALNCSLSALATDPLPAPAPAPTPESNTAPPTPFISTSDITARVAPLLDLLGDSSPRAEDKMSATAVSATDSPKSPKKSPIPIPPRRRNSNRPAPSPPTPKSPTPTHSTTVAPRKSAPDSPSLAPSTASPTQNTRKAAPIAPDSPSPAPTAFTFPASDTSTDKPAPTATGTVTPVPGTPTVLGASTPAPDPDKPNSTTKDTHTPAPNIDPTTTPTSGPNIDPTTTPTSVSSAHTTAFNADVTAAIVHENTTKSALVFPDILIPTPAPTSAPTPAPNAPTAPSFATPAAPTVTITPASTTYDTPTPTLTPHIPITTEPQAPEIEFELTNGVATKSPSLPAGPTRFQSSPTPSPAPVPSSSSFQANGDGFGADLQASGPPALEELDSLAKAAPLNDEKIFGGEKSKAEEVKTALSEVTTEHNNVTQTNASDSKA